MYASTLFLAGFDTFLCWFSYICVKEMFCYDIDITDDILKHYSKIGKLVLGLSCATIAFLLHEHDVILPHRKITVLLDPCFLLAVTCTLYIVWEISSKMERHQYELDRRFNYYRDDFHYFDRWGAVNRAIGITGLLSFGFAYLIIGMSVFLGK
jgi:hypothetical protein